MGVYRIQIKKQLQRHNWTNSYIVVVNTPFDRSELERIADTIAPKILLFERIFYSEEVEMLGSETIPVCDPPEPWIALRYGDPHGKSWQHLPGLRPFAVEESTGAAITLLLGLQPVASHWGNKDYRYALHKDEIQAIAGGYQLRPESRKEMENRLIKAKSTIKDILHNDTTKPALAVSASKDAHLLETYKYRRVQDIIIKGIHISKHRR
nr:hypothetical protein [Oscillochloris trichoides]